MHFAALATSLSLSLAAAPDVAERAAQVDDCAPIPTTPDDLLVSLQAPVPLENVRAEVGSPPNLPICPTSDPRGPTPSPRVFYRSGTSPL